MKKSFAFLIPLAMLICVGLTAMDDMPGGKNHRATRTPTQTPTATSTSTVTWTSLPAASATRTATVTRKPTGYHYISPTPTQVPPTWTPQWFPTFEGTEPPPVCTGGCYWLTASPTTLP